MVRRLSPESRWVVIEERVNVFVLLSPLKLLSAVQLVTGIVHNTLSRTLMLEYIEVACLRADRGFVGKLLGPCSFK